VTPRNCASLINPGAGCQDRKAQVALPIHSARRVRLGRDQAACFGGHGLARSTSKASAAGQPQQFLLRFGSHEWKTSAAKEIGLTSFESTAGYLRLVHQGLSGSGGTNRYSTARDASSASASRREEVFSPLRSASTKTALFRCRLSYCPADGSNILSYGEVQNRCIICSGSCESAFNTG
jgi:hypothetical protein